MEKNLVWTASTNDACNKSRDNLPPLTKPRWKYQESVDPAYLILFDLAKTSCTTRNYMEEKLCHYCRVAEKNGAQTHHKSCVWWRAHEFIKQNPYLLARIEAEACIGKSALITRHDCMFYNRRGKIVAMDKDNELKVEVTPEGSGGWYKAEDLIIY